MNKRDKAVEKSKGDGTPYIKSVRTVHTGKDLGTRHFDRSGKESKGGGKKYGSVYERREGKGFGITGLHHAREDGKPRNFFSRKDAENFLKK